MTRPPGRALKWRDGINAPGKMGACSFFCRRLRAEQLHARLFASELQSIASTGRQNCCTWVDSPAQQCTRSTSPHFLHTRASRQKIPWCLHAAMRNPANVIDAPIFAPYRDNPTLVNCAASFEKFAEKAYRKIPTRMPFAC